ncbi:hypothetical protein [Kitasatospora sp. LaBMicrA B282]|uniref:hypothetical protein n=1 Tax=Kitasatospora sp. LaBMicrA B282 TaxID=3420949 RepID=UPI003D0EA667
MERSGSNQGRAAFGRAAGSPGEGSSMGGGRQDLEPFWPSRQPHHFDQTCPGSPRASRLAH